MLGIARVPAATGREARDGDNSGEARLAAPGRRPGCQPDCVHIHVVMAKPEICAGETAAANGEAVSAGLRRGNGVWT